MSPRVYDAAEMCPPVFSEKWPDHLPTKVVAVIESVSPDGDRQLTLLHSTDCRTWDRLGMLHAALDYAEMCDCQDLNDSDDV